MRVFQTAVQDERWVSHRLHPVVFSIFYVTEKPAWWLYVAFQICCELCCRETPPLLWTHRTPRMRGSVYLPLSPSLRYESPWLRYNIQHLSAELKLRFSFSSFISGDVLAWYRNKPEGDYTRQNTNKNASPTFYHVFGEPLHPGELAKGLSEPQQMLPLPFWYLTSPCCNSRGPAGCSQRYWCLCMLQAPSVLLCTAPSARHMLHSLKALSGQAELLPGSGVVFTFPKRPPATAAPLLHGLRRNRRCHKKTESLCLIRRCCMASWILIKFTFKRNSNRALIHNLPCVFYKKTEKYIKRLKNI